MQARDEGHPHRCQHGHRWRHTGPTARACGIPAYDRQSGNLPAVRAELCPLCPGHEEVLIRGRHATIACCVTATGPTRPSASLARIALAPRTARPLVRMYPLGSMMNPTPLTRPVALPPSWVGRIVTMRTRVGFATSITRCGQGGTAIPAVVPAGGRPGHYAAEEPAIPREGSARPWGSPERHPRPERPEPPAARIAHAEPGRAAPKPLRGASARAPLAARGLARRLRR